MVVMQKQKKLRTTLIGTFKSLKVDDIGNSYTHKRQSVTITRIGNSNIGRAIVCDQHIIDKIFLDKSLNAQQHNVCNKYLESIVRSGALGKSSGLGEGIFTSHSSVQPPPRSVVLIKSQKKLIEECGYKKEKIFWSIMVKNPKSLNEKEMLVMQDCSNALLTFWFIGQTNPVSLFEQALLNPI